MSEKWQELRSSLRRVPGNPAPDAVHDIRVAIRSLRALLRSLRDEANPAAYAQLRFDLTNLSREFAAIRTADVHSRKLVALLSDHVRGNSGDRASLTNLLLNAATTARQLLAQRIREPEWQQRLVRIDAAMGGRELLLRPLRSASEEYRAMLVASLAPALRALRKQETSVAGLHRQRIRIKSARHVCAALAAQMDTHRLQARLDKAQKILGDIHDLHALLHWIQCAPLPTPLARRLVALLRADYARLLKKFQDVRPALLKSLRRTVVELRASKLDDVG